MTLYPIVCLPGLAGAATEFAALAPLLGRPVHALDPFATGDLSVDGQARQLADVVVTPAVVLGHSHGGLVALALAAARPDLVAAVVLLDAPVALPPPARLLAHLPHRLLGRFFAATFHDADSPAFRAATMQRLAAVPRATARTIISGSFGDDTATRLSTVDAHGIPVLCVRANIPIRLGRLPAAVRTAELDGLGHWPHVHAPERVAATLSAFLATADAGDRGPRQPPGPRVPGEGVPVDGDVELEVQPHRPGH